MTATFYRIPYLLFLFIIYALVSCGDIELPTNNTDKDKGETEKNDTIDTSGVLSVSQLLSAEAGDYVTVRCYIVGYATGTSSKGFTIGLPTESEVRSNIVIADTLEIDDDTPLAACQLKSNSAEREELNLVDNPDLLGQHIYLQGTVKKYFGLMGLYPVDTYELIDDSSDDTPNPPQPDPSPQIAIPINSEAAPEVFEGA